MSDTKSGWYRDHNDLTRYAYVENNHVRTINNPEYINTILLPAVTKRLNRKLRGGEVQYIVNMIRTLNPAMFVGKNLETITDALSSSFGKKISDYRCDDDDDFLTTRTAWRDQIGLTSEADHNKKDIEGIGGKGGGGIHESTPINNMDQISISSIFGKTNLHDVQNIFNPASLQKKNYLNLDSKYRSLNDDGTRIYVWNHVNNVIRRQGSVNTVGVIRDIIEMRVYPFKIPYVANADTDMNIITMLIEEFSAQSIIGHENRKYHFIFKATVLGDWIELDPYPMNEGRFYFNKPITTLDTLSVSFGSPLQPVVFDTDRLSSSVIGYASPTIIRTSSNHNLASGNVVTIGSFTSENTIYDSTLIAAVNAINGHTVTVLTSNTLSIPVDLSSMRNSITGSISVTNGNIAVVGTGTQFLAELAALMYIIIPDSSGTQRMFQIAAIADNFNLTLTAVYTGATESNLYPFKNVVGTITAVPTNTAILGAGTTFTTSYKVGDYISIVEGGVIRRYAIGSIIDDSNLTLATAYDGPIGGAGLIIFKDNAVPGLTFTVYFESKRTFMTIELTFISPP